MSTESAQEELDWVEIVRDKENFSLLDQVTLNTLFAWTNGP